MTKVIKVQPNGLLYLEKVNLEDTIHKDLPQHSRYVFRQREILCANLDDTNGEINEPMNKALKLLNSSDQSSEGGDYAVIGTALFTKREDGKIVDCNDEDLESVRSLFEEIQAQEEDMMFEHEGGLVYEADTDF